MKTYTFFLSYPELRLMYVYACIYVYMCIHICHIREMRLRRGKGSARGEMEGWERIVSHGEYETIYSRAKCE